jgi:FlaA1/EpsC-like NDP-sugar epimerase
MSSRTPHQLFQELSAQAGRSIDRLPSWILTGKSLIAIDATLSTISIWLAWQLRFDFDVPENYRMTARLATITLLVVRPACLWAMGAYRSIWRYFNLGDALTMCLGAIPPTIFMLLLRLDWLYSHSAAVPPLTVIVADYGVFLLLSMGIRASRRYLFEASLGNTPTKRTLLMGSTEGLASALRQISFHPEIHVIRLLSQDQKLHGARLAGFTVTDDPSSLARYLASEKIDLVLIADADVETIGDAVATAMEFGIEARLLPSASHVISGNVRISSSPKAELAVKRPIQLSSPPHPAVVESFRDRCVLITGAGGSIGSELSRRISRLPVARIVLLDHDENAMFQIHGELSTNSGVSLVPAVADIRDREHINALFSRYKPNAVLHAAAYKHVPVMEHNCSQAILNNVIGTRAMAEAAIDHGAERFLMISTDKAVSPVSVMGATKRMAELTVQHLARRQSVKERVTHCACVRFGNVMGSNGSVVPIFLRQIAAGGPVTITHEEMTRYFMTIPSAVELVLQATTLGSNGEIFMLDMGDEVKITTLARRLIEMSGLRPGHDIEIRFIGKRSGEKLHEQLWSDSVTVDQTSFRSVLRMAPPPPPANFEDQLATLEAAALTRNDDYARDALMEMPINYGEDWREATA